MLATILFFDGHSIPLRILNLGSIAQPRWGPNGDIVIARDCDDIVDCTLFDVLQNESNFGSAIEELRSRSIIQFNGSNAISMELIRQEDLKIHLKPDETQFWRQQAIAIISQTFPRDKYVHTQ